MKFLYIVDEFPPIGRHPGIRALEISKRLLKKDIKPIILTREVKKSKFLNLKLIKEIPSNLKIVKSYSFEIQNKFLLKFLDLVFRIDFYISWVPFAYFKAKKILKRETDIKFIYIAGPPFYNHIIGILLKKKFDIPLILEYRDPWSYNPYLGKRERWLNQKLDLIIERNSLQVADMIITVSSALTTYLKKCFSFINNKPIHSIPNGLNIYKKAPKLVKENFKILFVFAGSLYRKRSITPFLKIISQLKADGVIGRNNFLFKIFGDYDYKELDSVIKNLKIKDIIFLGQRLPRFQIFKEISQAHFTVHIGENLYYPTIAFKIWDYLSCRKKILYLGRKESLTAKFLEKNNFGFTLPIDNLKNAKQLLADVIENIRNQNQDITIPKENLKEFTWDHRANKFIEKIVKQQHVFG
ncbi:MAG: glycosyltransferase [Candidatus Lokiarchaeia archaeon]